MNARSHFHYWATASAIAAWLLFWSPQFIQLQKAQYLQWTAIGGTLLICAFIYRRYQNIFIVALIFYIPIFHLAQHPVRWLEPHFVALNLGNDRYSQVYKIGSDDSKAIEPTRENDYYRDLRYFAFWQTAIIAGFKPNKRDIPESNGVSFASCLAYAAFEKAIGVFPYWAGISALFGIYLFFHKKRGEGKFQTS